MHEYAYDALDIDTYRLLLHIQYASCSSANAAYKKVFLIMSGGVRNHHVTCVALAVAHAVAAQLLDQPTTPSSSQATSRQSMACFIAYETDVLGLACEDPGTPGK